MEAVCKALRIFHPWVYATPIQVIVDNQAAVSFTNPLHLSDFLKRRLERLSLYSPNISFSPSPFNFLADFLSRQGSWISCESLSSLSPSSFPWITRAQWKQAHAGHFGVLKTYLRFRNMGVQVPWWWVEEMVRSCRECQLFHRPQPSCPFGEWKVPKRPGQVIGLDFMGPFLVRRVGKYRFVLTIVDLLSKVGKAWAMEGVGSKEIGEGLNRWVRENGRPEVICADASTTSQSKDLHLWCERRGVSLEFSPPFHHASIEFVE